MGRRVRILSALVAGTLAFVVGTPTAYALDNKDDIKCQAAIAKEATSFVTKKLKAIQKCKDAELATPGSCPTLPDTSQLEQKLLDGLAKKCSFNPGVSDDNHLATIGFPGPCPDANPANGFTIGDLQACILDTHNQVFIGVCGGGTNLGEPCAVLADCPDPGPGAYCHGLLSTEYDPSITGPITDTKLKCQREYAKNSAKFLGTLLKSVQKCRNALGNCKKKGATPNIVFDCKLSGLAPASCKVSDVKTEKAVSKARTKAIDAIKSKCSDQDAIDLKLCEPDQGTKDAAATCTIQIHEDLTDNLDPAAPNDLIDYEYAQPGVCGDGRKNQQSEECDGISDSACPGLCGAADGLFPCLCQDVKRTRVIEHANADLDNGWTGQSHDSGIVEGGGYVADLWDCDGPGGPDTVCAVGPSCALPPHNPCNVPRDSTGVSADSLCTGGPGDFCRMTAGGSTGPHCANDPKKRCKTVTLTTGFSVDCGGADCIYTPHGAPLPLSSGGVSVCVVNTFTEDVTGTTDLATGAGTIRLRQNSDTIIAGDLQQPCPVCGGFCSGPGGTSNIGVRTLCNGNEDCKPGSHCVLEPLCSFGLDIDKPCRPGTPAGGPTEFFGNPSVDCRMSRNGLLGSLNILFNPTTTGFTSLTASVDCKSPGFTGPNAKACQGGPNEGRICTVDSECPTGTCGFQCFCPNASDDNTQRPNGCQAACLGGPDDAAPCTDDSECAAPGFCHAADCRVNPSDTDSFEEGQCTVGPTDGRCSLQTWKPCENDSGCRPTSVDPNGGCEFCEPTETCLEVPRQCFLSPTIRREGNPGLPTRVSAAIFCIARTASSPAVNGTAGLPGPGAITQPADTVESGF